MLTLYRLYNCDCSKHSNVDELLIELRLTYEVLFGAFGDVATAKGIRRVYGSTKVPPCLVNFCPSKPNGRYFSKTFPAREKKVSDYIDVDDVDPNTDVGLHLYNASLNTLEMNILNAHLTESDFY